MKREIAEYVSTCLTCQRVKVEHQVPSVDQLTKSAQFLLVNTTYSLEKLVEFYIVEIVGLHGIPTSIVSEGDRRFTSRFWNQLKCSLGTKLRFSTAFHPQADGQSERVIQVLEVMLRIYVIGFGINW
ncbi:Gag protease polyprotein [Gossypium australe]|uniref:Gag protease polyprotein n=1 Tax=Gossypium australe TaxID=47621 RepID=A0A5B6X2A4_9ROSI|nr:Gag protease polyprotein [Gossypium australe]